MHLDITRPQRLYRYSQARWLERALQLGEFRLCPAADYKDLENDAARQDDELVRTTSSPGQAVTIKLETGEEIKPIGDVNYRFEVGTNYLMICFSGRWDQLLFSDFPDTDACLIVHDVDEFCERIHKAAESALPDWVGMDGKVVYGGASPLGAVFSKPVGFVAQHEWRFAWRPRESIRHVQPLFLQIGSIERIAEIVLKPAHNHAQPNTFSLKAGG